MTTIVLDLDETLVHTCGSPDEIDEWYADADTANALYPIAYSFDIDGEQIWGVRRPGVHKFLSFVTERFDHVIAWSAGVRPYVDQIVNTLFLDAGLPLPRVTWARDECAYNGDYFHKPLKELINDTAFPPLDIDDDNMVIVDDKDYTFDENPGHGIKIPPFEPDDVADRSDTALSRLQTWLDKSLKAKKPLVDIDKSSIFDSRKKPAHRKCR